MHERYLFYVLPLVFCLFGRWLDLGLPRPRWAAATVIAITILPALVPTHGISPSGIDAPTLHALGFDSAAEVHVDDAGWGLLDTFHLTAILLSGVLGGLVLVRVARRPAILVAAVAVLFLFVDLSAHESFVRFGRNLEALASVGGKKSPLDAVDRAAGRRAEVAALFVTPARTCPDATREYRHALAALWRLEFFNLSLQRVIAVGAKPDSGLPVATATLGRAGAVRTGGRRTHATFVVADDRVILDGELVGHDRATRWSIWKIRGDVRLAHARTMSALRGRVCGRL